MNTNVPDKMKSFIRDNHISYKELENRTGMSPSNINLFLNNTDYGVTMPLVLRFLEAFQDKDIIDYIFEEDPAVPTSFRLAPSNQNVLTDGDIMQFYLLYQNAFTTNSPVYLNEIHDIFYSLLSANVSRKSIQTHFSQNTPEHNYITVNMAKDERIKGSIPPVLSHYIQSHYWGRANNFEAIEIFYPNRKESSFETMLFSGESITWTDISDLIRHKRISSFEKGKSAASLNKEIGLSANALFRLESLQTKNFKVSDITKIDTYFDMNGKFFAMCLIATRMSSIIEFMMLEVKTMAKSMSIDTSNVISNLDFAFDSFIKLFRNLQQDKDDKNLVEDFLLNYRNILIDLDAYREDMLRYTEHLQSWFFGRDPLLFYPYSDDCSLLSD